MRKIIFITLITFSSFCFSQISKFSVEASYPLPVDQNFVGDHFKGIVDLGIKYRVKNLQLINLGISLNASLLNYNDSGYFPAYDEVLKFKTTLYIIQPRIFAELNLKKITKLHPSLGIGYSFFSATSKFDSQTNISDVSTNQSGINTSLGLSYDLLKKIYILASYDYTIITDLESGIPNTAYNTTANIAKFGIGIRL